LFFGAFDCNCNKDIIIIILTPLVIQIPGIKNNKNKAGKSYGMARGPDRREIPVNDLQTAEPQQLVMFVNIGTDVSLTHWRLSSEGSLVECFVR